MVSKKSGLNDKLNEKQLTFCLHVAKGKRLVDAYCIAYEVEKTVGVRAHSSRLGANLLVKQKIAEFKDAMSKDFTEELQWGFKEALREAEEARQMAIAYQNPGSMVSATKLKAQLKGLLVERKAEEPPLTPEQTEAQLREKLSKLPPDLLMRMAQSKLAAQPAPEQKDTGSEK